MPSWILRHAGTHWVLSIMPKISEISVGIQIESFVSVSSDRDIRDHLWGRSTYFGRNIPTDIRRSIFDKPVLALIAKHANDVMIQTRLRQTNPNGG